jgi:hypothetical protein
VLIEEFLIILANLAFKNSPLKMKAPGWWQSGLSPREVHFQMITEPKVGILLCCWLYALKYDLKQAIISQK